MPPVVRILFRNAFKLVIPTDIKSTSDYVEFFRLVFHYDDDYGINSLVERLANGPSVILTNQNYIRYVEMFFFCFCLNYGTVTKSSDR